MIWGVKICPRHIPLRSSSTRMGACGCSAPSLRCGLLDCCFEAEGSEAGLGQPPRESGLRPDCSVLSRQGRQLESSILALKHQKPQSQPGVVKAIEQEKLSLKRECERLQKELASANRKVGSAGTLPGTGVGLRGLTPNVKPYRGDLLEGA